MGAAGSSGPARPRAGGNAISRIINPFVGLFVAIATLNAAMLIPMFLLLRDDIADMRAVQSEQGGRLARIEATQTEHGERLARLEAGQGALRGDLAATNERMARIEGTVAGALGRPFPERMAQAPGADADGGPGG